MQFSCESCKATLHIGDEKVKGKRLVVRCKKCGARIQIADPALGPPPAGAAPLSSAPVAAPVPKPAAESSPGKPRRTGDTDTERTQAMDSGVLEQALRASKADDSTMNNAAPVGRSAPPPPPPPEPRDPPVWFAMISGKQTGPVSRAELSLKVAQSQITPRTYLWREGMSGWQRAQEVSEVSSMFGPPPSKPPPPTFTIPPPVPSGNTSGALKPISVSDLNPDPLHLGDAPLPLEERRGRAPSNPGQPISLDLDDRGPGSSGIDLPLELEQPGKLAPRAQAAKAAPAPKPISSLFPPEREIPRDPLVPAPEPDEDDRTHVEPLPLGERVHQEAVANELFNTSSSESTPVAAKDLAAWASSELGKKPPGVSAIPKAPVPSSGPSGKPAPEAPLAGGAAQAPAADPFANVPNAPGFSAPDPVDTTGNVIARAGVKKSRAGTYLLIFGSIFAAFAVLMWQLNKDQFTVGPEQQQAEKQSVGGTGESVTGLVKGTTSGTAAAPQPERQKRVAAAASPAPASTEKKADDAAAAAAAAQQAQALAALDSEQNGRGIGSHGPKAESAAATPETSKADASLSQEDIAKKLGENKGALQSCITEALRKEPNLRVGKIHIATVITPSGTVASTKIDKRPVDDSPLGACLKRAIKRIVFPSFQGDEFEVDIPIVVTASE